MMEPDIAFTWIASGVAVLVVFGLGIAVGYWLL